MTPVGGASRELARAAYPTSPAFQHAFVDGASAASAGRPAEACPHLSRRGWSRPLRTAWLRGYHSVPPAA